LIFGVSPTQLHPKKAPTKTLPAGHSSTQCSQFKSAKGSSGVQTHSLPSRPTNGYVENGHYSIQAKPPNVAQEPSLHSQNGAAAFTDCPSLHSATHDCLSKDLKNPFLQRHFPASTKAFSGHLSEQACLSNETKGVASSH
jgi:hypothetical protein